MGKHSSSRLQGKKTSAVVVQLKIRTLDFCWHLFHQQATLFPRLPDLSRIQKAAIKVWLSLLGHFPNFWGDFVLKECFFFASPWGFLSHAHVCAGPRRPCARICDVHHDKCAWCGRPKSAWFQACEQPSPLGFFPGRPS